MNVCIVRSSSLLTLELLSSVDVKVVCVNIPAAGLSAGASPS